MAGATLKTLRLCVSDLKKSTDFYSRLFEVSPSEESENFAAFDISGANLELVGADEKNPQSTGGAIGYFAVDSLETYISRAKGLGAEVWRGPLKVNETGLTIVQIRDGAGNVIGFEGIS